MAAVTDPSKVVCVGEGLHFGYFKHPIHATVDTRKAGPGELTVYCNGPVNKAFCELGDHGDGTFTLTVRPQDVGLHQLFIKYNEENVTGSPFNLRVSAASLVEVEGSGITHTVLKQQGDHEFNVNSQNAGPGSLKIRVGGPSGAFKVQTKKENQQLRCRYNPRAPGLYIIHLVWSGDHIPGSPFHVFMARNESELKEYMARTSRA